MANPTVVQLSNMPRGWSTDGAYDDASRKAIDDSLDNLAAAYSTAEEATPSAADAAGVKGSVRFDDSYVYVCVATDTWKRVALSTWP